MSLISVIMSTYREPPEYIEAAVRSILDQTYRELELIIVLDDPENSAAEELVTRFDGEDSRITVIKNEKNFGLVGSLNRALGSAAGEYIARMDADDFSYPNRLKEELQYLKEHRLDMVGALTRGVDADGQQTAGGNTKHYTPEQIKRRLMLTACLPHPTWLAKKEVYDALKGYRQMPRCEDYDFLLRARKKGFLIGMCDAVLLDYRINAMGISQSGLLEQRLTGRYLADNYKRIESISEQEIAQMLHSKFTDKAAIQYSRADALFRQAAGVQKIAPLKAVWLVIKSMRTSKYYRTKIVNMVKLKLMS